MSTEPAPEYLLEIIKTQNEIASTGLDLPAVMDLVARRALDLTNAGAVTVEMVEGEDTVFAVAAGGARDVVGTRVPMGKRLTGLCVRTGDVMSSDNTDSDDRVDAASEVVAAGSAIVVPVVHDEITAGTLAVYSPAIFHFRSKDVEVLRLLGELIAANMAQAADFRAEVRNSRTDPLTGLGNRRAYDEALAAEVSRARRHDGEVALCLFEIDDFTAIGEELGHAASDEALREVAAILNQGRFSDAAFRLGEAEFAMVLPETTEDGAAAAGNRITGRIAAAGLGGGRVTAAFGSAAGEPGAIELHESAEKALRAATGSAPAGTPAPS